MTEILRACVSTEIVSKFQRKKERRGQARYTKPSIRSDGVKKSLANFDMPGCSSQLTQCIAQRSLMAKKYSSKASIKSTHNMLAFPSKSSKALINKQPDQKCLNCRSHRPLSNYQDLKPRLLNDADLDKHKGALEKKESGTSSEDAKGFEGPLGHLLHRNRAWAKKIIEWDPSFFSKLSKQQTPEILWIGCSDSRVPANEIVDVLPGSIFVHRNIANVVTHTDLNCLSVLQFAVEVLRVKHIIVCGHYGCGGVLAALDNTSLGLLDQWIRHIKDVYTNNETLLLNTSNKADMLTELNVRASVTKVCQTTIVQKAWSLGRPLTVHAWCYHVSNGHIKDLQYTVNSPAQLQPIFRTA